MERDGEREKETKRDTEHINTIIIHQIQRKNTRQPHNRMKSDQHSHAITEKLSISFTEFYSHNTQNT